MSQRKLNIIIVLLVSVLFFILFIDRIVTVVKPGESAIVFRPFSSGLNKNKVYDEGIMFIWPWNKIYKFNIRDQMFHETVDILVENGVMVSVEINYRFAPIKDSLAPIFRRYGVDYERVLVRPLVQASTRKLISDYTPEEIYSLSLDKITKMVEASAKAEISSSNIRLKDLVILKITLPKVVANSIENKLVAEQLSFELDFKITQAQKNKSIKIIEAEAIAESQKIIDKSLNPNYLRYKQIEAIDRVANSPNAKILIMPSDLKPPTMIFNEK